jgi:ActR/RegA family two-component response regulator
MKHAETSEQPNLRSVLALRDVVLARRTRRCFRRHGWEAVTAGSGAEARRLTEVLRPAVVVLDVELVDESGWLICDKLTREQPGVRVVLMTPQPTPELTRLAAFVRACGLVSPEQGCAALVQKALGDCLTAAG